MKQSKEQIEAYRTMAKQAPQFMINFVIGFLLLLLAIIMKHGETIEKKEDE